MEKRYLVNLNAYVYAEDDKDAVEKAIELKDYVGKHSDNYAQIISIFETPFAWLGNGREVYKINKTDKIL